MASAQKVTTGEPLTLNPSHLRCTDRQLVGLEQQALVGHRHTFGAASALPTRPRRTFRVLECLQGTSGDVWLVKYDVVTAIAEYAKLLGSRDTHEVVTDSSATEDGGVLLSMSCAPSWRVSLPSGP